MRGMVMRQKVWVIDDVRQGGTPARSRMEKQTENRFDPSVSDKNPAVAFSLSMLVWGSGHMYIREFGLGSIFMGCMILFYSAIAAIVTFRDSAIRFVSESFIAAPAFIVAAVLFVILGIFCWLCSAAHAYFKTTSLRSEDFRGASNEFWPLLCSLLFPGWGQFVNGQPRKGLFFLVFGATGLFSVSFVIIALSAWPLLSSGPDRFALEILLYAAFSAIPVSLLMWMASAHDSFWSCREPVRKRPFRTRWQFARDKIRTHGITRFLMPQIKGTAKIAALLAVSILAGSHFFPKAYYREELERIRVELLNQQMEVIPEMVGRVIVLLG
jgi:TM2 domain-containing membrane protein YozV